MSSYLDEYYFEWLESLVGSTDVKIQPQKYSELLHILYTEEFVWSVPNDDNRVEDGIALRHEFISKENIRILDDDIHWLEEGCSFLELIISLAKRMNFEIGKSVGDCFWELLDNLHLSHLSDDTAFRKDEVEHVLQRLNYRTYSRDGERGLFPLTRPRRDQRLVEIWYQLNEYLIENYS